MYCIIMYCTVLYCTQYQSTAGRKWRPGRGRGRGGSVSKRPLSPYIHSTVFSYVQYCTVCMYCTVHLHVLCKREETKKAWLGREANSARARVSERMSKRGGQHRERAPGRFAVRWVLGGASPGPREAGTALDGLDVRYCTVCTMCIVLYCTVGARQKTGHTTHRNKVDGSRPSGCGAARGTARRYGRYAQYSMYNMYSTYILCWQALGSCRGKTRSRWSRPVLWLLAHCRGGRG